MIGWREHFRMARQMLNVFYPTVNLSQSVPDLVEPDRPTLPPHPTQRVAPPPDSPHGLAARRRRRPRGRWPLALSLLPPLPPLPPLRHLRLGLAPPALPPPPPPPPTPTPPRRPPRPSPDPVTPPRAPGFASHRSSAAWGAWV